MIKLTFVLMIQLVFTMLAMLPNVASGSNADCIVYIGTYTSGESEGIYAFRLDSDKGTLTRIAGVTKSKEPSFVAVHPSGRYLYAVNETSEFMGQPGGGITAYAIDQLTGTLTKINSQLSHGDHPCHLMIDRSGRCVALANYTGGSIAAYKIGKDGSLSEATCVIQHSGSSIDPRQQSAHAHSIDVDRNNRFVAVSDLGMDQVLTYRLNARKGLLTPAVDPFVKAVPGAGPRHFTFHPNGKFAFGINELDLTATAYAYNGRLGKLQSLQVISTLPPGEMRQAGQSTAEMYVHPSGKFLYGSNRGHHTIVVYQIDQQTGKLTYVENEGTQGETPRSFGIDPSGRFLLALNQSTNSIALFHINQDTGVLEYTGTTVPCPAPVATAFLR
jgi:6-phosphogluconolactonase